VQAEPASTGAVAGAAAPEAGNPLLTQAEPTQPVQPKRPAHYLWAVLIARIYEVFPLLCPICKVKGARYIQSGETNRALLILLN
jgi:hypothetical protein